MPGCLQCVIDDSQLDGQGDVGLISVAAAPDGPDITSTTINRLATAASPADRS